MATLIKTLTMRLGDTQIECQLNVAEVTDEPDTEEVTTFCGKETFATPAYKLHLAGFQDWVDAAGLCDMLADAYESDPVQEIEFEIALGDPAAAWRSGTAKPTSAPAFGGTAGSALTLDVTLDVVGTPAKTALAA
jgi:hypothetical protein